MKQEMDTASQNPSQHRDATRKSVLFLCPNVPMEGGNGLSMRAAIWLRILARTFNVHLSVISPTSSAELRLAPELSALCASAELLHPSLLTRGRTFFVKGPPYDLGHDRKVASRLAEFGAVHRFDLIFVFRSYLARLGLHAKTGKSRDADLIVDCDESDSAVFLSIAALYEKRGESHKAAMQRKIARYCLREERELLPKYRRVIAASESEAETLRAIANLATVEVVPNTSTGSTVKRHPLETPFTFVFVGNLNYLPNRDAVDWLADEIIPAIRKLTLSPFQILVAGSGSAYPRLACDIPTELKLLGYAGDLGHLYSGAGAALCPIRAGGGTRIKVLEALRYQVPIVTTSIGASGLGLKDRVDVLIGDDIDAFAAACVLTMKDRGFASKLAHNGFRRFSDHFSLAQVCKSAEYALRAHREPTAGEMQAASGSYHN